MRCPSARNLNGANEHKFSGGDTGGPASSRNRRRDQFFLLGAPGFGVLICGRESQVWTVQVSPETLGKSIMANKEVSNPTYMADIRHFFTPGDKKCMGGMGIDLATYGGVKFNALRIYFKVRDGEMPLGGPRWTNARVETFYNWMKNGYPRGTVAPTRPTSLKKTDARHARRAAKREDAATYSGTKLDKLKAAFQGMMDKDPTDPDSYFALAGIHWLPRPDVYCRHHENAYNPWHRAYLNRFEDAMRRVSGCENVTLPYWDITSSSIPAFLFKAPFASYEYPEDLEDLNGKLVVSKGDSTRRRTPAAILSQIKSRDISGIIDGALGNSHWERFNGWDAGNTQSGIISAHDNGHNACGPTMINQDVAAFDPIFWFFHSNWDRIWWDWQRAYDATTVDTFKSHLTGAGDWLEDPVYVQARHSQEGFRAREEHRSPENPRQLRRRTAGEGQGRRQEGAVSVNDADAVLGLPEEGARQFRFRGKPSRAQRASLRQNRPLPWR